MKINILFSLVVVAIIAILLGVGLFKPQPVMIDNQLKTNLRLTVKNLTPAGTILPLYTCDGKNFSPPLELSGVPAAAQTLALTVIDPDAPTGQFVHWLMWNIEPQTKQIVEDTLPMGVTVGTGSTGRVGYVGPCPSEGTHHYVFKLLALDIKLDLPVSTTLTEFNTAAAGHIIATAEVISTYTRQPK
ncbi:MAG: YbhB/YbcL family Raf kinase inhibitor-like protein [bacterium]|nr:YbhB/YbcL family Raf kinase inhibitor-like protein [bacterium]